MQFYMPPDANVADIRSFGAIEGNNPANGPTNDQAFFNAFVFCMNNASRTGHPKFIYLPDGFWGFSNHLRSRVDENVPNSFADGWRSGMIVQGQSTKGTILHLFPNSPGYDNPAVPKGFIITGSEEDGDNARDPNPTGKGNQAFRHMIKGCTVSIGTGNPGAVAIDYIANNQGGIIDVDIVDEGNAMVGLACVRSGAGPALIKNVRIRGFDRGVYFGGSLTDQTKQMLDYHMTCDGLTLEGQRLCGFFNNGLQCSARGVVTYLPPSVPAFDLRGRLGVTTVADAVFYPSVLISKGAIVGTNPPVPTTGVGIDSNAVMYLKNIQNYCYGTTFVGKATTPQTVKSGHVAEHFTSFRQAGSAIETPPKAIELKVIPAPVYYPTTPSLYVNAVNFRLPEDGTLTGACIQRAIDTATEPIIYLPNGSYQINSTIILRNKIRKLIGYSGRIAHATGFTGVSFRFDDGETDGVMLEHLRFQGIVHNCKRSLTLRYGTIGGLTTTENSIGGKTFLEDVMGSFVISEFPHEFWAWQHNPEFVPVNVKLTGGTYWCNGLKVEGLKNPPTLQLHITQGAIVEIISSSFFPLTAVVAQPMIRIEDSKAQITWSQGNGSYLVAVEEWSKGIKRTLSGGQKKTAMFRSRF